MAFSNVLMILQLPMCLPQMLDIIIMFYLIMLYFLRCNLSKGAFDQWEKHCQNDKQC